jgi:uncharacterized protein (TIGR02217 family)
MSFDEIRLPLRISFGSSGGPAFSTEIVTAEGGFEKRNQNWAQARRRYDAATGLRSVADVNTLTQFFYARAGRARGFRLKDWSDFNASAQALGTGTGALTTFQLVKNYTSGSITHVRTITKPVTGTVTIALNGVNQPTGWSVNTTTGLITLSTAPGAGVAVTAGYEFDVPVRFDTDQLTITADNFQLNSVQIPLVEIRV